MWFTFEAEFAAVDVALATKVFKRSLNTYRPQLIFVTLSFHTYPFFVLKFEFFPPIIARMILNFLRNKPFPFNFFSSKSYLTLQNPGTIDVALPANLPSRMIAIS